MSPMNINMTNMCYGSWISDVAKKHVHNEQISNQIRILEDLYKAEAISHRNYVSELIRLSGEVHLTVDSKEEPI